MKYVIASLLCLAPLAAAQIPTPPTELADWAISHAADAPGVLSADSLLEKPAGKHGPIAIRDGHFFAGTQRIRFLGVNVCFAACYPTHEQADLTARRLARFGVNIVRFHHTDNQTFPNGIFADRGMEKFSPEALDRLDYFIAALKREGIYTNMNLHVSRSWSKAKGWENTDKLPQSYDKLIDVFYPELIAANKQYARDLLTHVNAYTKVRYADEPAIAMVEINNEDTLFLWGGHQGLMRLPEPYGGVLTKLWNQWLVKKYATREKLASAWASGTQPLGKENLLSDTAFTKLHKGDSPWKLEQGGGTKMTATAFDDAGKPGVRIEVQKISETSWHLQFHQPALKIKKGQTYTLTLNARADQAAEISVGVTMYHEPWSNLGLGQTLNIGTTARPLVFTFEGAADDDNARVSFSVGKQTGAVHLSDIQLRTGGVGGLADDEDPAKGNVARPSGTKPVPQRSDDWFDFLQQTDEGYFVDMRQFLKQELGVKAPITGTIGLGALGTLGQSKMDFVDAHAYWDHPNFPRRPWDGRDWVIQNKPMVDQPSGAAIWSLAGVRVAAKPFTITEYNHAAPNEWQAECVPMLAAITAVQDWDAVFLFDYASNAKMSHDRVNGYFSVEGNPWKLAYLPLASRVILGNTVKPAAAAITVHPKKADMLRTAEKHYQSFWGYLRDVEKITWQDTMAHRLSVNFAAGSTAKSGTPDSRTRWTAGGPGSGRFILADERCAIFAGFAKGQFPIDLGPVRIDKLESPFASVMLVPADPAQTIENADRLLLAVVGRGGNTNMQWEENRRSVSNRWGQAPTQIEVVKGDLSLKSARPITVRAIKPDGTAGDAVPVRSADGRASFTIGTQPTLWYELRR